MKNTLRSLLADEPVMTELRQSTLRQEAAGESAGSLEQLDALLDGNENALSQSSHYTMQEAIILLRGRPVLLVQDGRWEDPASSEIRSWLGSPADAGNQLVLRLPSVGRIEIIDSSSDYVGTGWMLDEEILITNRHVAEEFGLRRGTGFDFRAHPDGGSYKVRVDFRREHDRSQTAQVGIEQVLFIEDDGGVRPDMALVRVGRAGGLPAPIELEDTPLLVNPADRAKLVVIGYPAEDGRNDAFAMREIFKGLYRVKRLSPGRVMSVSPNGKVLEHDCTTLGGNSGSPVINLATGKACGLHYAGTYRDRNFAVTAAWLKSRLQELSATSTVALTARSGTTAAGPEAFVRNAEELGERVGYKPDFLGESDDHRVPLPDVGPDLRTQIAPVDGSDDNVLHYMHFSIQMRKDRRMPFFTACNIDGGALFNFARGRDRWFFDGRIARDFQIGEDLYRANKLDRGHLVRRLDPVWGETRAEAKQAELDTFAFTNCTPQHSRLNQRTWLSLEDYILGHADTHALKVSVFTGPVMADDDLAYRGIQIPREFWKVALMVHSRTGLLSATGYLLTQADYLRDLEFVFGAFRTYQVPLSQIERKTGLYLNLSLFDPLHEVEGFPFRELRELDDIVV